MKNIYLIFIIVYKLMIYESSKTKMFHHEIGILNVRYILLKIDISILEIGTPMDN